MKFDKIIFSIGIISSLLIILSFITYPRITSYHVRDKSISKKHKPKDSLAIETISLASVIIPLLFFCISFRSTSIEFGRELQFYICFLTCHIFIFAVVENTKNIVGRLRPDFLDRCKPIGNICTGEPKIVQDGRKSFPSGHSAVAACGYSYLIFFINSGVVSYREGTFVFNLILKISLSFICLLIPTIVGFTRFSDNRHHITDILAGIFIGFVSSFGFFKYFGENLIKQNLDL